MSISRHRPRVCSILGGVELDEYARVTLLSMIAPQSLRRHLYTDTVRRRREELNSGGFKNGVQIFFEEVNKVLGGVDGAKGMVHFAEKIG